MLTDGRSGLNGLTTVAKPNHKITIRAMPLRPWGGPRDGALTTPVPLFLYASSEGHASSNIRICCSPVSGL